MLSEYPQFVQTLDPGMRKDRQEWSDRRLKAALRVVTEQCQRDKVKLFLFLDGLDEFEEDGVEQTPLLDLIQDLVQSSQIKALVSSRPETLFINRLSSYQSIRLQDLTWNDISSFVQGSLLQGRLILDWNVSKAPLISFYFVSYFLATWHTFMWPAGHGKRTICHGRRA